MLTEVRQPAAGARRYGFHGVGLSLSGEPAVLAALDARLRLLAAQEPLGEELVFEFTTAQPAGVEAPGGSLRPVYDAEAGDVLYAEGADVLYLTFGGRIRAACDATRGHTRIALTDPRPADLWLLSHPLLTLPLLEMLKRRGLYGVHAAGLSRSGRGVLLIGTSGSGKTTLALALARAGFDFLGDDMLFLSRAEDGVRVHAFPDEVDITETTAGFFPELRPLLSRPRPAGWPKWSFRPEALYPAAVAWTCAPAALVFPRIAHTATSRLEPLAPHQAFLELLPNVLLTDPAACQAHLATLAQLTRQAPCYRLWTGQDFEALPELLGRLLR